MLPPLYFRWVEQFSLCLCIGLAVSCTLPLAQLTHADGRVLYDSSEVLSVPVPYLEQLSALGYPDDFIPVIRRMLSLQPTERLSLPQVSSLE